MDNLAIFSSPITSEAPISSATSINRDWANSKSARATVNVKSVLASAPTFCTIISTSILAALIGVRIFEAIPGWSLTPRKVNFASSRVKAIPEIRGASIIIWSSEVIRVPGTSLKLDKTRRDTRFLLANSTARVCNTLEPELASSNISSKVIRSMHRASLTTRGSVV